MIKINLLNSVTERAHAGGVAAVERKVSDPRTQMGVIAAAMGVVMLVVMGFDYMTANAAQARAETELAEQKRVAEQMAAIIKEQKDLEKQTNDIKARVAAIQALRSTQKGPVAVLSQLNEYIQQLPANFNLEGVEQKGGNLTITGDSPNEGAVTQFGRSLEFSSGLFSNVSIEIQRKAMEGIVMEPAPGSTTPRATPETVSFTVKCNYTPPSAGALPSADAATTPAAPAVK